MKITKEKLIKLINEQKKSEREKVWEHSFYVAQNWIKSSISQIEQLQNSVDVINKGKKTNIKSILEICKKDLNASLTRMNNLSNGLKFKKEY